MKQPIRSISMALLLLGALALAGCGGGSGAEGPTGAPGDAGRAGPAGPPGPSGRERRNRRHLRRQFGTAYRSSRFGVVRARPAGHGHQRHHRQPAGRQVLGHRFERRSRRRPRIDFEELDRDRRRPDQPRVLDRQARSRHQRQPEQVGELHRHHGADDHDRGGADPAEHRQHRHAGRQPATAATSTRSIATSPRSSRRSTR